MKILQILIAGMLLSAGSLSAQQYEGEVSDGRSFGEVIATEMTGSTFPDASLVNRFNRLISSIGRQCSQGREWVSDRILGGHQMLTRRGGDATLLDVAVGWNEAVAGGNRPDCSSVLAGVLVQLENGQ